MPSGGGFLNRKATPRIEKNFFRKKSYPRLDTEVKTKVGTWKVFIRMMEFDGLVFYSHFSRFYYYHAGFRGLSVLPSLFKLC